MESPARNRPAALITGASAGIGRELARLFAADGRDVVLVARREAALRELADELAGAGGVRADVLAADLGTPGAAAALVARVRDLGVEVDALVNCAGLGVHAPFLDASPEQLAGMVQVNVVALTELTRLVCEDMAPGGRVLNVASLAAYQPGPLAAVYHATKAYVLSLSEALAIEFEGRGITVTALCPGPVDTEFHVVAELELSAMQQRVMATPRDVALAGYKGMLAGRRVVLPGALVRAAALGSKFAPRTWSARITKSQMERAGAGRA